jgi:hypothetical protein
MQSFSLQNGYLISSKVKEGLGKQFFDRAMDFQIVLLESRLSKKIKAAQRQLLYSHLVRLRN